jgi:hypothetical protein
MNFRAYFWDNMDRIRASLLGNLRMGGEGGSEKTKAELQQNIR